MPCCNYFTKLTVIFGWPTLAQCSGKWSVQSALHLLTKESTNEYSELSHFFSKPSLSSPGQTIDWFRKSASSPRKPALAFGHYKDESKTYEWNFFIVKQD